MAPSLEALKSEFDSGAHRELWQYLLLVCLLLAIAEPLLANWLRPDRGRATAHPTPGRRAA